MLLSSVDAQISEMFLDVVQYAHTASCARSGVFGCGGKDYSSSYGHVHEGNAVVFM